MKKDGQRRLPNPAVPRNMNEKFFWRKIFDRSPEFVEVSDKLRVRNWLKEKQIKIDAPPVLWVGYDPEDIPDDMLKDGVVVKANHGSATNIFLDEPPADRAGFHAQMRKFRAKNHGRNRLEWAYFDIERRIFVERLIPDTSVEFKFYTFGDKVGRFVAIYDRTGDMCADVWLDDAKGGFVRSTHKSAVAKRANRPLPPSVQAATQIARDVGAHFDHMRVDILSDGVSNWFSELTVYSLGGHSPLAGDEVDAGVNVLWKLENSWFMKTQHSGWRAIYARRLRRLIESEGL